MNFLGIGPLELVFVILIAIIIFGPKDIVKASKTVGGYLRKLMTSPTWQVVRKTSKELQNLPNTLAREAGLDEIQEDLSSISPKNLQKEIKDGLDQDFGKIGQDLSSWTTPPSILQEPEILAEPEDNTEDTVPISEDSSPEDTDKKEL
jgi:sec-independent protein translocase protein TatB